MRTIIAPARNGTERSLTLRCPSLKKGGRLLLLPEKETALPPYQVTLAHSAFLPGQAAGPLAVGTVLRLKDTPLLSVQMRLEIPVEGRRHSLPCIQCLALSDVREGELELQAGRSGPALAWITVSDKGAAGERLDESGPAIEDMAAAALPLRCANGYMAPDEIFRLRALVADLALVQGYDLIITSGGTGLSERDRTPEAMLPLIEKRLPGFEHAMLAAALQKTPRGAISRAVCGTVGRSILLTLPGSLKAVRENLAAVLPALGHALDKLQGNTDDCGQG
ncbi:MAG: MogA/MoaB family molybdenum cofactor biosynthesis protein [Deltaproteobacteria bacterium]|jgi:molybdenum cofactor synthesis domain-containing protein|nr:MogA/MoaB family molybdenum cofactor biosynthesis protein [Deltaproteobacteria bacterium]